MLQASPMFQSDDSGIANSYRRLIDDASFSLNKFAICKHQFHNPNRFRISIWSLDGTTTVALIPHISNEISSEWVEGIFITLLMNRSNFLSSERIRLCRDVTVFNLCGKALKGVPYRLALSWGKKIIRNVKSRFWKRFGGPVWKNA